MGVGRCRCAAEATASAPSNAHVRCAWKLVCAGSRASAGPRGLLCGRVRSPATCHATVLAFWGGGGVLRKLFCSNGYD